MEENNVRFPVFHGIFPVWHYRYIIRITSWRRSILRPDGSRKKIIFYNLSIGAFLQNPEQIIIRFFYNLRQTYQLRPCTCDRHQFQFLHALPSNPKYPHPGENIGKIIAKAYTLMQEIRPDALLILGDTNSALTAISAKRLKIPIVQYIAPSAILTAPVRYCDRFLPDVPELLPA